MENIVTFSQLAPYIALMFVFFGTGIVIASFLIGRRMKEHTQKLEEKILERTTELSHERARLQASINSLNVGVLVTDTHNIVVMINNAAKQILYSLIDPTVKIEPRNDLATAIGVKVDIAYVQRFFDTVFLLPDALEQAIQEHRPVIKKEIAISGKYLHIFIAPIETIAEENIKKESIGAVIVIQDITEQKSLERAKDEFFSIASHELRTPLTAIKGNTALIRDYYASNFDPSLKQMIDDIHDASNRLIKIVNDFLNVSRLEQSRMVFKNESFDLSALVHEASKDFASMVEEHHIYMHIEQSSSSLPYAFADKDRVREVLNNLIGNAIKFTKEGGITIRLSADEVMVSVSVTDTGKGIPLQNQNLLFKKFQQASNNILTRDTTQSTGLGLYISKLIIESMKGKIFLASSQEDKGATFTFQLPVYKNDPAHQNEIKSD